MDRKQVELLMGGEGQGGVFTWREKNRRKVCELIPARSHAVTFHDFQLAYSVYVFSFRLQMHTDLIAAVEQIRIVCYVALYMPQTSDSFECFSVA